MRGNTGGSIRKLYRKDAYVVEVIIEIRKETSFHILMSDFEKIDYAMKEVGCEPVY